MADSLYEPRVYRRQGGDAQVVKSGGKIIINAGGYITPSGESVAAHIANFTSSANMSSAQVTKINNILVALRGVGILATS